MKTLSKIVAHSFNAFAFDLGLHTTQSDSNSIANPEVVALTELINPTLAKEFGKVWELFSPRAMPFQTEEYEVLSRAYTSPVVTLGTIGSGTDWNSTSDTTALPITASTIDRLSVGDILLVNDVEVVVVSAINSGDTIDVYERGAAETTATAHTGTLTAKIIGNTHVEGTANGRAMAEQTGKVTNYCQLVEEVVDLSKADTDQARKIGRTEQVLKQEALTRIMRDLARTAIFGYGRVATATIPAMTRGLLSSLNDVTGGIKTAVTDAFTEASLIAIIDDVRAAGGTVNAIVLSVANKRVANGFTGADSVTTTVQDKIGGKVLDGYLADGFGVIPFVVDIDMPNDKVAVVNTNLLSKGWKVNDNLAFVPFQNVNPRENKQLLAGKFGLVVEGIGTSHGLLTGLTTGQ